MKRREAKYAKMTINELITWQNIAEGKQQHQTNKLQDSIWMKEPKCDLLR